jgi:octaprenyl-diphosphate synthase
MQPSSPAQEQFDRELDAVRRHLAAAAAEIVSPLSELVSARIRAAMPHLCAAVVLAAAYNQQDDDSSMQTRVSLAAALEMLHIALSIHQLLAAASATDLDKSLIGSAILAGDYCFGRAARLAAQTDNPRIVAIFSHALQDISENNLRALFDNRTAAPGTPAGSLSILLRSGAAAALELSNLSDSDRRTVLQLAACSAAMQHTAPATPALLDADMLATLPASHQERWCALQRRFTSAAAGN